MAYKSQPPGASRYFDHLYDPTFEISGTKNFYQYNYAALSMSAKMQIIPIYGTMFTDLPTKGRFYYAPVNNPLPYYSHYTGGEKKSSTTVDTAKLVGPERFKFFSEPVSKNKTDFATKQDQTGVSTDNEIVEKFREIGCQTIYRESSAQTKPWMPHGKIGKNESEIPEVVYVADLIKNDTLPGEMEAEIVERARKRRAWEKSLDKFKSTKDWNEKRNIVQAFEWEQWVARENEIQECQKMRLKIIEKLMHNRDNKNKQNTEIRLEQFNERVLKEKDHKLANIKVKYQREMRKLEMKHKKIQKKYVPRNNATEHIDRASDLYGPQMRFGRHPRQRNYNLFKTEYEPRFDPNEKIELYSTEIQQILHTKDKLWKPKIKLKTIERSFWTDGFLTNLYETLKLLRETHDAIGKTKQAKCVIKIQKSHTYITHLAKKKDSRSSDYDYQNTIFFQKLIKGRAVQNILYRGRNKCRDLIAELQSVIQLPDVTALYPSKFNIIQQHKEVVLEQQSKQENLEHMCDQIKEIPIQADSSYMYFLFDFLGKELIRLEDQRKTHALYLLAEEERYKREAAEAGQRQVDEFQRIHYDEIYRRIVRSTQDTVETYLENALTEGIDKIAEQEALTNVRKIAKRIDALANSSRGTEDRSTVEEIVSNFVFPEVYKHTARKTKLLKQQRHLLAAHMALYGVVEQIPFIEKAPTSSEKISSKIIQQLIEEMPTTPLSELSLGEDPATHEAHRAIDNIINDLESLEDDSCCHSQSEDEDGVEMLAEAKTIVDELASQAPEETLKPEKRSYDSAESQHQTESTLDPNDSAQTPAVSPEHETSVPLEPQQPEELQDLGEAESQHLEESEENTQDLEEPEDPVKLQPPVESQVPVEPPHLEKPQDPDEAQQSDESQQHPEEPQQSEEVEARHLEEPKSPLSEE